MGKYTLQIIGALVVRVPGAREPKRLLDPNSATVVGAEGTEARQQTTLARFPQTPRGTADPQGPMIPFPTA